MIRDQINLFLAYLYTAQNLQIDNNFFFKLYHFEGNKCSKITIHNSWSWLGLSKKSKDIQTGIGPPKNDLHVCEILLRNDKELTISHV